MNVLWQTKVKTLKTLRYVSRETPSARFCDIIGKLFEAHMTALVDFLNCVDFCLAIRVLLVISVMFVLGVSIFIYQMRCRLSSNSAFPSFHINLANLQSDFRGLLYYVSVNANVSCLDL